MSENMWTVAMLSAGMVLAGLLLGVGLYVGYKAGRNTARVAAPRRRRGLDRYRRELQQCASLAHQVARHAEQLTVLASAAADGSAHRALSTARDLLEHSATLSQRLERLLRGSQTKPAGGSRHELADSPAPVRDQHPQQRPTADSAQTNTAGEAARSSLSARELGQITETEHHDVASEDGGRKHYAYDCVQTILPWSPGDALMPTFTDGVSVRCHDISGKGVSFFWPRAPQFEHVIISLGSDCDLLFMAAQIASYKPAEMDGAAMYLITCQFIRRMDELTAQWAGRDESQREAELAEPALSA
jgi:hypothetical protein